MKNNLIALSICIFAVCFVIGCWLISDSLSGEEKDNDKEVQHQLMTKSEVANYLGISPEEVQKLTEIPNGDNSFTSEIPHIKIGKKNYYPIKAIDKWLQKTELIVVP
ncbi:DNA-binding protein [Lysinibacillus yapensis]|uniref:DNA-binding protein n=1 Tax=Ureibacillus yapensis TaxID=2304605 RepID=A0A396S3U3_9BACL|nr:helix-turn-helix domain-containing protein [Lysinibacillus yapensis]RHW31393.1 DNA-binding protein [Lysinibacillus yapensis]